MQGQCLGGESPVLHKCNAEDWGYPNSALYNLVMNDYWFTQSNSIKMNQLVLESLSNSS